MNGKHVYAVHAVHPEEICATEVIFTSPTKADEWAAAVSTDPGVLAGAVTRYTLDSPGERHPQSLYVKGERQQVAHLSDDREVAANGYLTCRGLRTAKRRKENPGADW